MTRVEKRTDIYLGMLHFCLLKSMLWGDRALAAVGLLRELSVGFACPFHCGSSSVWPFLSGLAIGLCLGLGFGLLLAWIFLRAFFQGPVAASSFATNPLPRPSRLLGYLHEL